MIVFDVTDPDSFNNLNTWLMEIEKYKIFIYKLFHIIIYLIYFIIF